MTRQQAIFIITLNAIISLVISLLVVWIMAPRLVPSATLQHVVPSATPTMEPTSSSQVIPPAQPSPPATPTPIIHVVKKGDSLSWIAEKYDVSMERLMEVNNLTDPNVLVIGQKLIIPPLETPTPTEVGPSSTATPTEEELHLAITEIVAPGRLEAEVLVLANYGRDVELQGWTLSNDQGQVYTFPKLKLFSGNRVYIHTTKGRNSTSDLYWGLSSAAWGPEVKLVTLKDPEGKVQATYSLR